MAGLINVQLSFGVCAAADRRRRNALQNAAAGVGLEALCAVASLMRVLADLNASVRGWEAAEAELEADAF